MNTSDIGDYELVSVIVNFGMGSKILHAAKQNGISGGTVLLGKGTVNNKILDLLGISDERKEIVLMVSDEETAGQVLSKLNEKFHFEKPNHGIAFTTPVCSIAGTSSCKSRSFSQERGDNVIMYNAITVVVDRGKGEDVIDAAVKAGAKGGTIINGRGSGIHETSKVFFMDIEPEKEIVQILVKSEVVDAIVSSIREQLKIDEPGNGIIFIQGVNKVYGLYD